MYYLFIMQKLVFLCVLGLLCCWGWSQETATALDIDDKYLEDQFYAGLVYNFLVNRPGGIIQRNLSYGIQFGYIKDIPFNKKRNFGMGVGVGYATNSYYTNLLATKTDGSITYEVPDGVDFNRGKFETHGIEFPIEIRWRTSNPIDYKFWRIYGGAKIEYLFSRKSKYVFENTNERFGNDDIRQWNYGLMLNFGYNTFNIHLYYSLKPLLGNTSVLDGEEIGIRPLRVGIIFYIL